MGTTANIAIGGATFKMIGEGAGTAVDVGFTKGGTAIRHEAEFVDIIPDQNLGVVEKRITLERMFVKATILEVALAEVMEAAMRTPAANLSGTTTLTLGYDDNCVSTYWEVEVVGVGPACATRTYNFPKCIVVGSPEMTHSREEELALEIEFEVLKTASTGVFGTIVDS
mgnify:CR=1 FL=1